MWEELKNTSPSLVGEVKAAVRVAEKDATNYVRGGSMMGNEGKKQPSIVSLERLNNKFTRSATIHAYEFSTKVAGEGEYVQSKPN